MGKDPDVFRERDIIADGDPSLGVDVDVAIEKGEVAHLDILAEVEPEIFLGDEPCAASFKEMLCNEPPEKDRKVYKEAQGKLIKCIPEEVEVPLFRCKGVFAPQRKEFAVKFKLFNKLPRVGRRIESLQDLDRTFCIEPFVDDPLDLFESFIENFPHGHPPCKCYLPFSPDFVTARKAMANPADKANSNTQRPFAAIFFSGLLVFVSHS